MRVCAIEDITAVVVVASYLIISRNQVRFKALIKQSYYVSPSNRCSSFTHTLSIGRLGRSYISKAISMSEITQDSYSGPKLLITILMLEKQ